MPSIDRTPAPVNGSPHVVVVGAGFGGLALAIVTALLLWIGNEVQSLAVRMARVETRLDIQDRLSGGGQ